MQGNGKGQTAKTAACIDAETLAAWAEGGLPNAEAAMVEVHLADCERCTAMLATFVRTTPETTTAPESESLWQRWNLRWLVPLATAATVAALWVLVPRPGSAPDTTTESAVTTEAAATPAPQSPTSAGDAKAQEPANAPTDQFAATPKRELPKAAPVERRLAERERAATETREEPTALADARQAPAALAAAAPAPPPPATPSREADRADQNVTTLQEAAAAAPPAAPAPGASARATAPSPAPPPAAARSAISEARRQAAQGFATVIAQVEVVSPDPMVRWRVIGAGQVERSTTGGAQWVPATMPESATLTAGSSPSPTICWLVGRTGAIYVTTDGLRFVKVPFPDRTDFISIQAIDGRRATVVTSNGRRMQTDDQGATWIRVSP